MRLTPLLSDHAVVQRHQPIPVWGWTEKPRTRLRAVLGASQAWQQVAFAQFHDAITGTHVDAANREMMQFLDEAEAVATRHLPAVPPAPVTNWRPHSGQEDSLRLGQIDVRFDRLGILSVTVSGQELLRAQPMMPTMHALRVGELTLESDFGDA